MLNAPPELDELEPLIPSQRTLRDSNAVSENVLDLSQYEGGLPFRLTLSTVLRDTRLALKESVLGVLRIADHGVTRACMYHSPLYLGVRLKCPLGFCFPDSILGIIEGTGYNSMDLITLCDKGIVVCDDSYTLDAAIMLQRLYDLWCRSLRADQESVPSSGPAHWWRATWREEIEDDILDVFPQYWSHSQRFRSYRGHFEAFLEYLEGKQKSFMEPK